MQSVRAPRARGGGLPELSGETRADVVRAVWWETRAQRAAIHRQEFRDGCDVAVRCGSTVLGAAGAAIGPYPGVGLVVAGDCPCRDHLVDMLVGADRFLRDHDVANPAGAVRRHIRTRLSGDWIRARRATVGAQTRTDRVRAGERARSLPDEFHRALLEYLVDEAGSPAPLEGEAQLEKRLAERARGEFGGTDDERLARVRAALPAVRDAGRSGPRCRSVDGRSVTWWDRYVEEPLGRRPRRDVAGLTAPYDDADGRPRIPEPACPHAERAVERAAGTDAAASHEEIVLVRLAQLTDRRVRAAVVCRAVGELARCGVLPDAVAEGFVRDPRRVDAAVAALRAVRRDDR